MSVLTHDAAVAEAPHRIGVARLAQLCWPGPLDCNSASRFLQLARALARSSGCVVVDLADADFVDSSGVRALLTLAQELEAEEKQLRLVIRPGSRVERTLRLLRLLERLHKYDDLASACR